MILQIHHETTYRYEGPVSLSQQTFRLFPRIPGRSEVRSYSLDVDPKGFLRWARDAHDNDVAYFTYFGTLEGYTVKVSLEIETLHKNPFDFVLTDAAEHFPPRLTEDETIGLKAYQTVRVPGDKAKLLEFLKEQGLREKTQPLDFLLGLNRLLPAVFTYNPRWEDGTQTPAETIERGSGTCRDFAWLFVEMIRHLGFAARVVNGYLATESSATPSPQAQAGALHAWAEAFLPGAGWVGLDPTNGVLCDDAYVPTAVGMVPHQIMPIEGKYFSDQPTLCHHSYQLSVKVLPEPPVSSDAP
jgi:transglutaminase-like putative cysteine protease